MQTMYLRWMSFKFSDPSLTELRTDLIHFNCFRQIARHVGLQGGMCRGLHFMH